jgi:hypothetical protein
MTLASERIAIALVVATIVGLHAKAIADAAVAPDTARKPAR